MSKDFFNGAQVARVLGQNQSYMIRLRKRGEGPPAVGPRTPKYPVPALRAYLEAEVARRHAAVDAWAAKVYAVFNAVAVDGGGGPEGE